jgi:hypothetical protein
LVHEVPLKCSSTGATFRRSTPGVRTRIFEDW